MKYKTSLRRCAAMVLSSMTILATMLNMVRRSRFRSFVSGLYNPITPTHIRCHGHQRDLIPRHSQRMDTSSGYDVADIKYISSYNTWTQKKIPAKFVPIPFDYHQEMEVMIESLTNQGWGVGRVPLKNFNESSAQYSDSVGNLDASAADRLWVVMVPHVIEGELVKIRIFRNMKNYSEADLVEVISPSRQRVQPRCSLAGICGGCQYQHMSIEAQRHWKTKHVEQVLLQQQIRSYNTPETLQISPTIGTDEVYEYRSKLTPHYQAPLERPVADDDKGHSVLYHLQAIGFQQSSNRNLVDVPSCPIATPAINESYQQKRELLSKQAKLGELNQIKRNKKRKRGSPAGALGATLLFRQADNDPTTGEAVVITDHNTYMTTTVNEIQFRYQAGNFFQNNNFVLPLMVDAVVKASTAALSSTGRSPSYLIDCYCGSGLFALSAASHFKLCVGIEVNEKAVQEASENAKSNVILNCQFVAASAEAIFTSPPELTVQGFKNFRVQDFRREETVVVLDPPRKGCSIEFLNQLYEYSPQRIVYLSCGPAAQARDAKGIVEVGGYDITFIQPFDLFPQTKHIESLIVFEKRQD